jgi:opacity protein-like surface antigen
MKSPPFGIKCLVMVVLVLTLLVPLETSAQTPFYITFKPGVYSPKSSGLDGYDTGFNGEIAFGWRFNRNLAAEFGLGYFNTRGEEKTVGATYVVREDFDIEVVPITLTLKAILPYKRWELFGLAGGGVYIVSGPYDYDYNDYDYHHDYDDDYDYDAVMGGYLGGGLHYNVTPNIFLGVEGKYLWTDKAKLKDDVYGIPLEARFKLDGFIATAVFGIRF